MNVLSRLDDRCHRVNCRLIKGGRRADGWRLHLFRILVRLERPVCDRVTLMDHVIPPRSRRMLADKEHDHDDA